MKTQQDIYNALFNLTSKHVKNYREDLTKHDKNSILNLKPGAKFIHITREHGTHLTKFWKSEDYPKAGERVKYLFSATANRQELLKENKVTLDHYLNNSPRSIYFFDGKQLKKITKQKAEELFDQYMRSLIFNWEMEEKELQLC